MILDSAKVLDVISTWIGEYAKKHGKNTLVIPQPSYAGSYDLLEFVCEQAKVKFNINFNIIGKDYIEANEFADLNNGLVLAPTDRTYGLYYRRYSKVHEGIADLFPFFDLESSDEMDLRKHIWPDKSSDLSESCKMLEFCNSSNALYGVITNDEPPQNNSRWPYFTAIQKKWISDVHHREKKTKHKALTKPYPIIPCYLLRRI